MSSACICLTVGIVATGENTVTANCLVSEVTARWIGFVFYSIHLNLFSISINVDIFFNKFYIDKIQIYKYSDKTSH